jgi:hypothetical protein
MKAKIRAEVAKLITPNTRILSPIKKCQPSKKKLEYVFKSKREMAIQTLKQSYINSLTIRANNEEHIKRRQSMHNYILQQDESALKTLKNYKDKIIKDTIKRLVDKKSQEEIERQEKINQLKELSVKIGETKEKMLPCDPIVQQRAELLSTII